MARRLGTGLLVGLAALAWAGWCWAADGPAVSRMRVPQGWRIHQGQTGLVVMLPPDWRVTEVSDGAFMVVKPGAGGGAEALALAQPMGIEGRAEGVVMGLGQILPQVFPGVRVSQARTISTQPEVAEARLDYLVNGQPYQGSVLCFKLGNQGMLYATAASREAWPRERATAMGILQHFLYAQGGQGGGVGGAPGGVQLPAMVTFTDPNEHAFSCQVPQGWRVSGGAKRFHAIDVRAEVVAESPADGLVVRLGDAEIPSFAMANQFLASSGFPEGSNYSPGYGLQQVVLRYLPGVQFAVQWYLPRRVGQVGEVKARDLPEISRPVQALYNQAGIPSRVDTGEATFNAQTNQGPARGYIFVQTIGATAPGQPNLGTWKPEILYGYLARPDREALAQAVLNAMVQSYRTDPEWQARQSQTTGKVSGIVTQTNDAINRIIRDTFENRQRSQDRALERYDRGAIRGTVLVEDPNTGQKLEVPGGSNYYWRGPGDTVVGTQTDTRPYSPNHWLERMKVLD